MKAHQHVRHDDELYRDEKSLLLTTGWWLVFSFFKPDRRRAEKRREDGLLIEITRTETGHSMRLLSRCITHV